MAVTENVESNKGNILLSDGTSITGKVKTITQSVGVFRSTWDSAADNQKYFNIVSAMTPCLDRTIYGVKRSVTYSIVQ